MGKKSWGTFSFINSCGISLWSAFSKLLLPRAEWVIKNSNLAKDWRQLISYHANCSTPFLSANKVTLFIDHIKIRNPSSRTLVLLLLLLVLLLLLLYFICYHLHTGHLQFQTWDKPCLSDIQCCSYSVVTFNVTCPVKHFVLLYQYFPKCVPCPAWLFYVLPWFHTFPVCCSGIF